MTVWVMNEESRREKRRVLTRILVTFIAFLAIVFILIKKILMRQAQYFRLVHPYSH